mgnify:CR=1 FL=1
MYNIIFIINKLKLSNDSATSDKSKGKKTITNQNNEWKELISYEKKKIDGQKKVCTLFILFYRNDLVKRLIFIFTFL